jgi:ABC-type taurine transport system substrate-binding protein
LTVYLRERFHELAQAYADYNANASKWTPNSLRVKGIVKMIC